METKRSESIMNLAAALAVAQGQIKTAPKDNTAKVSTKSGGEFTYKYSTLDDIWNACRKPLSDNGLSVVQIPINDKEGFYLETILLHSSGEWMSGTLTLPIVADRMSQLQAMGSTITYARRYMLGAMVGVTTGDDDDGAAARKSTGRRGTVERAYDSTSTNGDMSLMSLEKLLTLLRKVEVPGMATFYDKPKDILACRAISDPLPADDDVEGWRNLFVDARDYAIDRINEAVERGDVSPDQLPLAKSATATAPEHSEGLEGFGQVEPDEVEADQTPF